MELTSVVDREGEAVKVSGSPADREASDAVGMIPVLDASGKASVEVDWTCPADNSEPLAFVDAALLVAETSVLPSMALVTSCSSQVELLRLLEVGVKEAASGALVDGVLSSVSVSEEAPIVFGLEVSLKVELTKEPVVSSAFGLVNVGFLDGS